MTKPSLDKIFQNLEKSVRNDATLTERILEPLAADHPTVPEFVLRKGLEHLLFTGALFLLICFICLMASTTCSWLGTMSDGSSWLIDIAHPQTADGLSRQEYFSATVAWNAFSLLEILFRGVIPFSLWLLGFRLLYVIATLEVPLLYLLNGKENHV